ncbi:hypothetical protein LZ198_11090 [Myxococcus sp. K15C18031901]|uniref:hypothetical protein n=1 Tax=Myxococcus dinghuensis TaxID=2906761 RepID=UPI0020A7EAFA|nr:hypothetical protein [Myxococcus dinghuensis]MCP3099414.1 hypothetical protein [Myxococcus dinghuensis]
MSMKAILVSLLLLGAAPDGSTPALSPDSLAAPPLADESPTAWACTIDTLREGKECVFESDAAPSTTPSPDQDSANRKLLKDISNILCSEAVSNAREGRADAALTSLCERRYVAAVEQCGLRGAAPVVDAKGRFVAQARTCYRALSTVLQEVQLMASVAAPCCECAARNGCPGTGDRCFADLSRQSAAPATLACLNERCESACSMVLPSTETSGARTSSSSPPRERASRAGSASL